MTHFTVGIIVPQTESYVEGFIAQQMEPYCENSTVDAYVSYTLEQAAAEIDRDIKRLEKIIARQDPDYRLDKCRDSLSTLRKTMPEERYREYVQHHEQFNDQGLPVSTYNPDSKWDWYVIGGRWDGWINDRESTGELISDNSAPAEQAIARNKIPHAIITPDGEWHERGQMGWWAILITENDNWDLEARAILARYPGCRLVIVDAHI